MHKDNHIPLTSEGLKHLIELCNQNHLPSHEWQQRFIRFFREICLQHVDDRPKYTICLTGLTTVGLGNPFSPVEAFVILDDPQDAKRYQDKFAEIEESIKSITLGSHPHHLPWHNNIRLTVLCLTKEQFIEKIQNSNNIELYINAVFNAVAVIGQQNRLFELQNATKNLSVNYGGRNYANLATFLYGIVVCDADQSNNEMFINILHDLIRPLLATVNGLRIEYSSELVDPKLILRDLMSRGKFSLHEVNVLVAALNIISKLKWEADSKAGKPNDVIKINLEVSKLVAALVAIRQGVKEKLAVQGQNVQNRENALLTISHQINSDDIFNITDCALKVFSSIPASEKTIDSNSEIVFQGQKFAVNSQLHRIMLSFNDYQHSPSVTQYINLVFLAYNKALDPNQFRKWMAVLVRRCAFELFDEKGMIKPAVKELVNQNHLYDQMLTYNTAGVNNQIILQGYFLNIFILFLSKNQKLSGIHHTTFDPSHPESSINHELLKTADDYFQFIYQDRDCIQHIQSTNYYGVIMILSNALRAFTDEMKKALSGKKRLKVQEADLLKKFLGEPNLDNDSFTKISASLTHYFLSHKDSRCNITELHRFVDRIVILLDQFREEATQINTLKEAARKSKFIETPSYWKVESRISKICKAIALFEENLFCKDIKVPASQPANGR